MLSIFSFVFAFAAAAIAIASSLLGWRHIQRSRQRLEELSESICHLRVSQDSMERNGSDAKRRLSESELALAGVRASVEELQGRFEEVESYAAVCVPQKPASSGLNINRRVEAVRLLKEGHSEEQVASELSIALSEVRLIGHLERNAPKPAAKRGRRVA